MEREFSDAKREIQDLKSRLAAASATSCCSPSAISPVKTVNVGVMTDDRSSCCCSLSPVAPPVAPVGGDIAVDKVAPAAGDESALSGIIARLDDLRMDADADLPACENEVVGTTPTTTTSSNDVLARFALEDLFGSAPTTATTASAPFSPVSAVVGDAPFFEVPVACGEQSVCEDVPAFVFGGDAVLPFSFGGAECSFVLCPPPVVPEAFVVEPAFLPVVADTAVGVEQEDCMDAEMESLVDEIDAILDEWEDEDDENEMDLVAGTSAAASPVDASVRAFAPVSFGGVFAAVAPVSFGGPVGGGVSAASAPFFVFGGSSGGVSAASAPSFVFGSSSGGVSAASVPPFVFGGSSGGAPTTTAAFSFVGPSVLSVPRSSGASVFATNKTAVTSRPAPPAEKLVFDPFFSSALGASTTATTTASTSSAGSNDEEIIGRIKASRWERLFDEGKSLSIFEGFFLSKC